MRGSVLLAVVFSISTRFGDVPQIHGVTMPGGARQQITFFTDGVAEGLFNPSNVDKSVFSKDTGGGEFSSSTSTTSTKVKITLLTKRGRSRNTGALWSRDGKQITYSSTARDGQTA